MTTTTLFAVYWSQMGPTVLTWMAVGGGVGLLVGILKALAGKPGDSEQKQG
jgi:hypothetical protein